MVSGYEKEPDYGGPEPTWWGTALIVAVMIATALLYVALVGPTVWTHPGPV